MIRPTDIERHARVLLAKLRPGDTLSTAELAAMVASMAQVVADDRKAREHIFAALDKLGAHARDMCDLRSEIATKGFNKGRTVQRRIWKHLATADMPATRRDDREPASSLVDAVAQHGQRLRSLEDRIADLEARFNPLSRVL